jgi:glutathione synthase/RimK-type ligase-like ATP-grasp enzyme
MQTLDAASLPPSTPDPVRYVHAVCRARGWRFELVDRHSGYLAVVSDGRRSFVTGGGRVCAWPLNSATALTVATDKSHAALLLARAGLRVPVGEHFFVRREGRAIRGPGRELGDALAYAARLGWPVFVKPNDGARGALVERVADEPALRRHLRRLARVTHVALVQAPVPGDEYRVFVLDGAARFAWRRTTPHLVGDGRRTLRALLRAHDARLRDHSLTPDGPGSTVLAEACARVGIGPRDVVPAGLRLPLSARRNLSTGGAVADFTAEVPAPAAELAARAAAAVGLRVCGVDLITTGRLAAPGEAVILEVNGNPGVRSLETIGRGDVIHAIWGDVCERALAEGAPA